MHQSLTFILLAAILLTSCRPGKFEPDYTNFKHVVKKGKFELYVPGDMRPDKKLNSKSDLQYADTLNTLFLIIIREEIPDLEEDSIEITLEEYFEFAKAGIAEELTDPDDDNDTVSVINGIDALSCELEGEFAGQDVYYRITVLSDENYFYQIIYWTFSALKASRKDDLFASVESFKIK